MITNHYVYILYSQQANKYYVGVSTDPERRLSYHNQGKSGSKNAFTKRACDWKIVYSREFKDRSGALRFEKNIKKQKSREYIENLIKSAR